MIDIPAVQRRIPRFSLRTLLVFILALSFGGVLYLHWEPWGHAYTLAIPVPEGAAGVEDTWQCDVREIRFSPQGERLLAKIHETYDLQNPEEVLLGNRLCLWKVEPPILLLDKWLPPQSEFMPIDPLRCLTTLSEGGEIVDSKGELIDTRKDKCADLEAYSRTGQKDGDWYYAPAVALRAQPVESGRIRIEKKHRPEAWWGVFWLQEFYAVILSVILLGWSVWRDLRSLGRQVDPGPISAA